MSLFRLYIDESGNHRYNTTSSVSERYLSLCGVVIEKRKYDNVLHPRMEELRKLFYSDIDYKPPFHLEDIIRQRKKFSQLSESQIKDRFNSQFLDILENTDYSIVNVVIDKNSHNDRYVTPEHPYHYALTCLLERYCKFLRIQQSTGDVMAEVRGRKEDQKVKEVYGDFFKSGTQYADPSFIQQKLTSKEIKLRTKEHLVVGLEFADLLALPSKIDVLHSFRVIDDLSDNFTREVIDRIKAKYYRGATGVNGNGKKFIC